MVSPYTALRSRSKFIAPCSNNLQRATIIKNLYQLQGGQTYFISSIPIVIYYKLWCPGHLYRVINDKQPTFSLVFFENGSTLLPTKILGNKKTLGDLGWQFFNHQKLRVPKDAYIYYIYTSNVMFRKRLPNPKKEHIYYKVRQSVLLPPNETTSSLLVVEPPLRKWETCPSSWESLPKYRWEQIIFEATYPASPNHPLTPRRIGMVETSQGPKWLIPDWMVGKSQDS